MSHPDYKQRMRINAIVRKVLGIKTFKYGRKIKVIEPSNKNKDMDPAVNILDKRKEKLGEFYINEEIFDKLIDVFCEYDGQVSLVASLGILDLIKDKLKEDTNE